MEKEYNLEEAWRRFKVSFVEDNLEFPKLYNKVVIRDIYWTGLYNKEILVEADEIDNMTLEEIQREDSITEIFDSFDVIANNLYTL